MADDTQAADDTETKTDQSQGDPTQAPAPQGDPTQGDTQAADGDKPAGFVAALEEGGAKILDGASEMLDGAEAAVGEELQAIEGEVEQVFDYMIPAHQALLDSVELRLQELRTFLLGITIDLPGEIGDLVKKIKAHF